MVKSGDKDFPLNGISFIKILLFIMSIYFAVRLSYSILNVFFTYSEYEDYIEIVQGLVLIFVLIVFSSIRKEINRAFNFDVFFNKKLYIFLCLGFFLFFVAEKTIFTYGIFIDDSYRIFYENKIFNEYTIIGAIITIAIAPVLEEISFRVILFGWLYGKLGFFVALIVSSVFFGVIHLDYPAFGIVGGFIYAILYKYSKSIIPSILLHAIWNFYIVFRSTI